MEEELSATVRFLCGTPGNGETLASIEATKPELTPEATGLVIRALGATLNGGEAAAAEGDSPFIKSLEGAIHVAITLTQSVCDMESGLASKLAVAIIAPSSGTLVDARLRAMAVLYNLTPESSPQQRYEMFLRLVELASKLSRVPAVLPALHAASERFISSAHWDLEAEKVRSMYGVIVDALRGAGMTSEALHFNLKRLETYQKASDAELDSVSSAAAESVCDALRAEDLYRFDALLELDAVQRLQSSSNASLAALYELLTVFVGGMLADYVAFEKGHQGMYSALDVDHAVCLDKMRLLTLTSLARDCQDVKYGELCQYLEVDDEQVEEWVVRGIRAGLVDAKMNQVTRVVSVNRASQRSFTKDQWGMLSERINTWKDNVEDLLQMLRTAKLESAVKKGSSGISAGASASIA